MPQDLFDAIVVVDLMMRVDPQSSDDIFSRMLEEYLRSYPAEERGQLKADIYTASHQIGPIVDQLCDFYVDKNDSERSTHAFAVLKMLLETLTKRAKAETPFLRRIFGGTLFNYERHPQIDRVGTSRVNIAKAAMIVIAKQIGVERRAAANFDADAFIRRMMHRDG